MAKRTRKVQGPPVTPSAISVQLGRLFGARGREAQTTHRSPRQWQSTLRKVLRELHAYRVANVHTDELHDALLDSGLKSAHTSLTQDDFWPGYVEGITRFVLLLMGDYPDHRSRRTGPKPGGYYRLSGCRTLSYAQTTVQRMRALEVAHATGFFSLSQDPRSLWITYQLSKLGPADYRSFLKWYRHHFPEDYAKVF